MLPLSRRLFPHVLSISAVLLFCACSGPDTADTVHVIAHDYAFVAPESARAGRVTFTLENRGAKLHELFIGLLRPGTTPAQILEAHTKGIPFRQLSTVYLEGDPAVALFASPGTASPARAMLDLERGRSYILFCQLRDTIGLPQHAAMGMFRLLRVH